MSKQQSLNTQETGITSPISFYKTTRQNLDSNNPHQTQSPTTKQTNIHLTLIPTSKTPYTPQLHHQPVALTNQTSPFTSPSQEDPKWLAETSTTSRCTTRARTRTLLSFWTASRTTRSGGATSRCRWRRLSHHSRCLPRIGELSLSCS